MILQLSMVFGQTLQDLQKIRDEYEKMQRNPSKPSDLNDINDDPKSDPRLAIIPKYNFTGKDSLDTRLKYFGYDFFTNRDSLRFWENLPTTSDYILGPGDKLVISLWGETQIRNNYTVSRSGNIYDDKVGLLNISGKTINQALIYLKGQFGRVYSTLNNSNPRTFIDLSIGELRSINVNFVGEVKFPGVYAIHPFSTVITGLIQSGGVDTTGSLRKIKIIREGVESKTIDLYDYFLKGSITEDIQLKNSDIVFIPIRNSTIKIDSAVMRPGIYEAKDNENLQEIINYAGGITNSASRNISISRIIPINKRITGNSPHENYYVDLYNDKLMKIRDGDEILVRDIYETSNGIKVIGQVKKPGIYNYYKGMRVRDLIDLTGILDDSTYRKSIFLDRAEIVRKNPETRYEDVIEINLKLLFDGNDNYNLELENQDKFVIHANRNYFEKKTVIISGEVRIPGSYPLISDNETLKSIIDRAGGFTERAQKKGISIYRDIKYIDYEEKQEDQELAQNDYGINLEQPNKEEYVRVAWKNNEIKMMPGDSIIIKEKTGTVYVSGQVYNPGLVEFQEGRSINYYINAAGGINQKGNKRDVIIIYSNGIVAPKKLLFNTKIEDGSSVIVNKKEEKSSFNIAEFTTTTLSIVSTTVTILVLTQQLSNSSN